MPDGKRVLTALIAIPLLLSWLWVAKAYDQLWLFVLLIAIATGCASWEYARLIQQMGIALEGTLFTVVGVLSALAYGLSGGAYEVLILAAGVLTFLLTYPFRPKGIRPILAAVLGLVYLPYLLHFAFPLFAAEDGFAHLATLLALVWAYDTGAYLAGSRWGKHKLAPQLSPRKSWEGVLGGMALAIVVGLLSSPWMLRAVPPGGIVIRVIALALLVSGSAQLGDLFESRLKRAAGVKDSGSLFPGHGGALDRIDAVLFALPAFYLYVRCAS